MTCGIYKIENLINHKCYIGQSTDIKKRWKDHRSCGKNSDNREAHKPLYKAMYKYGLNNFDFSILEECLQDELNEREIYWIKEYNSLIPNGYNLTFGGNAPIIYNYNEILSLWNDGFFCNEIEEIIGCEDQVIHKALISLGISQEKIYERVRIKTRKAIVALDHLTREPLKSFKSITQAEQYFGNYTRSQLINNTIINNKWKAYGYYWEFLNKNNIPEKELSDEEFLNHQGIFTQLSEKQKIKLSLKNRTIERPSREEFKKMIRTVSFLQLGNRYGVSDNAIRKWCDYYNLPRRKKDINVISNEDWELI